MIMNRKRIRTAVIALAMAAASCFPALAFPATEAGTMPNDIEIKNGDGTPVEQIPLGDAFGTAYIEDEWMKENYWYESEYFRRMPDTPAYRVHEDAVFIMPADGYYEICIEGSGYQSYSAGVKTSTEWVEAKKGDVIPLVNKEIKLSGGDMGSYLYRMYLVAGMDDSSLSGTSSWSYRVGTGSAQSAGETSVPAAGWSQDDKGWRVQNADGSWMMDEWYRDDDGKWYYMGADGYMLTDTTTPDGYKVNADGVWIQ